MNSIGNYSKSITYIALAAATFLVTALSDDVLALDEGINLGIVLLGAVGVYWVPNAPENVAKYAKSAIAFLTAGAIATLSFLTDGVSTTEWLQIGVAALAGIGVTIIPNVKAKPVVIENVTVQNPAITRDGYHG